MRYKAVIPATFNERRFMAAIEKQIDAVAHDLKREFERSTRTWNDKPAFNADRINTPTRIGVFVGTDDTIYRYVHEGTKAHVIRARRARFLRFFTGGSPKTRPNVLDAQGGAPGDAGPIFRYSVNHPGTKARRFNRIIERAYQSKFNARMEHALSEGRKRSGHAI